MPEARTRVWHWPLAFLLLLVTVVSTTHAAKHGDFKTCTQSSFCRRLRSLPERAQASGFHSPYSLGEGYLTDGPHKGGASWTFPLDTELYPEISFALTVDFLSKGDGIARLRVDEVGSKLPWKRYNEAANWALVDPEPALTAVGNVKKVSSKVQTRFMYGVKSELELVVDHAPFKVTFRRNGEDVVYINERNLFHMEHFRSKVETPTQVEGGDAATAGEQRVFSASSGKRDTTWFEGEPDAELWEERFSKWTDSKPKGECQM